MNREEIIHAFESIHSARSAVNKARARVEQVVDRAMPRLLHEAAREYISIVEVAKALNSTPKRVRGLMREAGMNPTTGVRLRAEGAAQALRENADLLGIEPAEMDFMSPLAYLPMGNELRQAVEGQRMQGVTEVPPTLDELAATFRDAWNVADDEGRTGERVHAGLSAVFEHLGTEVPA